MALYPLTWLTLYLATMDGHYVPKTVQMRHDLPNWRINGVQLYNYVAGDTANPPVVVVHDGPGGDMGSVKPLLALQDAFFVALYDQRGCGHSARLNDPSHFALDSFVVELDSVVRLVAGKRPVRLVGQGWGCLLILRWLERWAQYDSSRRSPVHSAVLISPKYSVGELFLYGEGLPYHWQRLLRHFETKHFNYKGDPWAPADYALLAQYQRFGPPEASAYRRMGSQVYSALQAELGAKSGDFARLFVAPKPGERPPVFVLGGYLPGFDRAWHLNQHAYLYEQLTCTTDSAKVLRELRRYWATFPE